MNGYLKYRIAEHDILIYTPNKEATFNMLPNFAPFHFSDETNGNELFRFLGKELIEKPEVKPSDRVEWYGKNSDIYSTSNGTIISVEMGGIEHAFHASPDWKEIRSDVSTTEVEKKQFLNQLLIAAYGAAAASHSTIKIHASVIEKNGKALLFLGKSGTGKSTHSRLWQEFVPGCTLLNDDEPVVRVLNDGSIRVYGTPWSGKTPCYRNESAEVIAFVHLYQNSENKLTKLRGLEAFTSLFVSTAVLRSDMENRTAVFNTISAVLEKIPVYRLDCRPDREAVSLTETLLH